MKNRVLVEICGREFALKTDESEIYMRTIASEINKMINESSYKSLRVSKSDAALLICLDLYDQNTKLNESNDNMRAQITTYVEEIGNLKKQLLRYRTGNTGSLQGEPEDNLNRELPEDNYDHMPQENNYEEDELDDEHVSEPEAETEVYKNPEPETDIESTSADNAANVKVAVSNNQSKNSSQEEPKKELPVQREVDVESLKARFNRLKNKSK